MSEKIQYTCKGKGGRYEILGLATGAGLTRGEDRLVYQDVSTGRLFLRTEADFSERMERMQSDAAQVVERKPPIAYMRNEGTPNNLVKCTFICEGAFGVYREPQALVVPTDEQILEVMRPGIYHADGGYVFDTAKEDVIAAGRALINKVKELNQ